MSWEAVTAIASLITAIVIAATAITAVIQIRHLRTANQLSAALNLYAEQDGAELRKARTFVSTELEERMRDPAFREALLTGTIDRDVHIEIKLGNYWEKFGLLMRTGLLDKILFLSWGSGACVNDWRLLRDVTRALRTHRPTAWRDFEYLARLATGYLDEAQHHPLQQPRWVEGFEDLDVSEVAAGR